jgi:hypothetical protein
MCGKTISRGHLCIVGQARTFQVGIGLGKFRGHNGFCYEIGKKKSLTKHFHLHRMVVKEEFLNCGNLCINHGILDVGRRIRGVAMS